MERLKERTFDTCLYTGKRNHLLRIPVITGAAMHGIRTHFFSFESHPARKRWVAGVLCFILIMASVPVELSAQERISGEEEISQHALFNKESENPLTSLNGRNNENNTKGNQMVTADETEAGPVEPAFGIISKDIVWKSGKITGNGKLTIEKDVTLTLTGPVEIEGNVVIDGEGVIKLWEKNVGAQAGSGAICAKNSKVSIRNVKIQGGSVSAIYASDSEVTIHDVTIQDCNTEDMGGGIRAVNSEISISHSIIRNCQAGYGGAIFTSDSGISIGNHTTIQDCQADHGGAITAMDFSEVSISDDVMFQSCQASQNGGAMEILDSEVSIDHAVIQNCQANAGGAISVFLSEVGINHTAIRSCQASYGGAIYLMDKSMLDITGSTFRNNICSDESRKGCGAIYHVAESAELFLHGDVYFCGNEDSDSGMDGIMLNDGCKFKIPEALTCPAMVYARASEGRVIAEGADGYILEVLRDVKKIIFSDTGNSVTKWYPVLDEEHNRILLSRTDPGYGFTVFYMSNGAQGQVADTRTYQKGENVTIQTADNLDLAGHRFAGWNTKPDGSGENYQPGEKIENIDGDIYLYAVFAQVEAEYRVEYYLQDIEGDGYTLADDDTKVQKGMAGDTVEAEAKAYTGFTENTTYPFRRKSGVITEDGSLVLKLYYDRILYRAAFHMNGGDDIRLDEQEIRYGGYLKRVSAERKGYSFRGWYRDMEESGEQAWDFDKPVEENTNETFFHLYARWTDDIAPVLGEISYNKGYADLEGWIICDRNLVLTVPITEEGSGIKMVGYILVPETGEKRAGEAELIGTSEERHVFGREAGQAARVVIDRDFKGMISLNSEDNAGNVSADRTLTAGGGVIVEDYAPEIFFSDRKSVKEGVSVSVTVRDDAGHTGERRITGGLSRVSYWIDGGEEKDVEGKDFSGDIVPYCDFAVNISGAGEHTLKVMAVDNAGNESRQEFQVAVAQAKANSTHSENRVETYSAQSGNFIALSASAIPPAVLENEPDTGDKGVKMEAYAATAGIAGLLYLFLYFCNRKEQHVLAERKKNGHSVRRQL